MTDTQYNEGSPQCPSCGHAMTSDEMLEHKGGDLFDLAPKEGVASIRCPACDVTYHCQGSYKPTYTTALIKDLLMTTGDSKALRNLTPAEHAVLNAAASDSAEVAHAGCFDDSTPIEGQYSPASKDVLRAAEAYAATHQRKGGG